MREQGSFELWRTDDVLNASLSGIWNGTVASQYRSEFIKQASMIAHAPWAHIVYLDSWILGTPEIEPIIQGLVKWCNNNNLAFAAHVYSRNMLKEYQLNKMLVSDQNRFELCHFDELESAISWLKDKHYDVQYPQVALAKRFA
jgi:hypothetical protein